MSVSPALEFTPQLLRGGKNLCPIMAIVDIAVVGIEVEVADPDLLKAAIEYIGAMTRAIHPAIHH